MRLNSILLFLGCMLVSASIFAQSKVIDVWQSQVPGAVENTNMQLIADSSGSWTFMRNITHPLLDMYPASAAKSLGAAVIICPGGGYWGLAIKHEGYQVAAWLNNMGVTAFVLKSRLPDSSIIVDKSVGPLQDAQEAMRIVRRNAKVWNINPNQIGILGFSAGGHLASSLSVLYDDSVYHVPDHVSARPDFSILIYPVISMDSSITHMGSRINLLGENPTEALVTHFSNEMQVDTNTPPAFLVHSMDDDVVPVLNSINYALALKNNGVPCELHIYQTGGHGYGMGRSDNTESTWTKSCEKWLQSRELIHFQTTK